MHDAQIGAERAGEHGDRGRGQRPEQRHVHAHRDEARGQRRLQHVARKARVLADHHPMAVIAAGEMGAGGKCQPERDLGRHRIAVGGAAHAVGAEELAAHAPPYSREAEHLPSRHPVIRHPVSRRPIASPAFRASQPMRARAVSATS